MHASKLSGLLSMGTLGHNHLLGAAQKGFALADAGHGRGIESAVRLLCMAWAEFPLNGPLAAQIHSLSQKTPLISPILPDSAVKLAGRLAQAAHSVDDEKAHQLFAQGRYAELDTHFDALAQQRGGVAVAREALMLQGMLSKWEWLESFFRNRISPVDPDLATALLPDILLGAGRYEQAVSVCEKHVTLFGLALAGPRLAAACAGTGALDRAQSVLARVLAENPAHTSALLALDSLVFPAGRTVRLPGKCMVAIYSYNKSRELGQTLESVLASDLAGAGDVCMRVLINGSEDDSLAVAEKAREQFPGDMDVIGLPVNVGAPAARNWLLEAARREGAEWIAYLDDDVLLPTDWLVRLAAGTEDFPDAGVWGCRVADALSPSLTQHSDGYLLDRTDATRYGHDVVLVEPGIECLVPDFLAVRRYCASVTGCCHLFRVDTLTANRGFDLGFSPSQFDDLDSDLRLLKSGKPAAYLGDLTVTHLRPANPFMEQGEGARILGESHRSLLETRHEPHLDELVATQTAIVDADLEGRRERLREAGLLRTE